MFDVGSTVLEPPEHSGSQPNGRANDGTGKPRWQPQFEHGEPCRCWMDP
jgi:hypothetical protein